jgi:hypothetical protein
LLRRWSTPARLLQARLIMATSPRHRTSGRIPSLLKIRIPLLRKGRRMSKPARLASVLLHDPTTRRSSRGGSPTGRVGDPPRRRRALGGASRSSRPQSPTTSRQPAPTTGGIWTFAGEGHGSGLPARFADAWFNGGGAFNAVDASRCRRCPPPPARARRHGPHPVLRSASRATRPMRARWDESILPGGESVREAIAFAACCKLPFPD